MSKYFIAHYTCDRCGRVQPTKPSESVPLGWVEMKFSHWNGLGQHESFDICPGCINEIKGEFKSNE